MMKKRTVLVAIAIAAALITVGAGVARCSMRALQAPEPEKEAQAEQPQEQTAKGHESTLDVLIGHAWVAADGSGAVVEFKQGAFVEKGAKLETTAFEIVSDTETKTQKMLMLTPIREGLAATDTALIVDGSEGSYKVSCDAFAIARQYVQTSAVNGEFYVTGVDERFYEISGTDEESLRKAVSEYCAKRIPAASSASFDGEVFIDMNSGLCSATLHANDASKSIVTVTVQSGSLKVSG